MLANPEKFYIVCVWCQTQQTQAHAYTNLKSWFLVIKRYKKTTFAGETQQESPPTY